MVGRLGKVRETEKGPCPPRPGSAGREGKGRKEEGEMKGPADMEEGDSRPLSAMKNCPSPHGWNTLEPRTRLQDA